MPLPFLKPRPKGYVAGWTLPASLRWMIRAWISLTTRLPPRVSFHSPASGSQVPCCSFCSFSCFRCFCCFLLFFAGFAAASSSSSSSSSSAAAVIIVVVVVGVRIVLLLPSSDFFLPSSSSSSSPSFSSSDCYHGSFFRGVYGSKAKKNIGAKMKAMKVLRLFFVYRLPLLWSVS